MPLQLEFCCSVVAAVSANIAVSFHESLLAQLFHCVLLELPSHPRKEQNGFQRHMQDV
jgi:hypothetical protein